jgi:hypothetical protein
MDAGLRLHSPKSRGNAPTERRGRSQRYFAARLPTRVYLTPEHDAVVINHPVAMAASLRRAGTAVILHSMTVERCRDLGNV